MKFIFHGATREVGRSCVEVIGEKSRFLLDAGIKLSERGTEFPTPVEDPGGIKAVFVSHAHLDHTGFLPLLNHQGLKCPIFATNVTKDTTKILLEDAFKIGRLKHEHLGYEEADISKAIAFVRNIKIDENGAVNGLKYEFHGAGHIPGSASVYVEADSKKILYTGDIRTTETRLMKASDTDYIGQEIDIMIVEATYGDRDHPDRKTTEKQFLDEIRATIDRGGSVLIPVFAVGRAQEILLMLQDKYFEVPIYIDGLAVEATTLLFSYPNSINDVAALKKAFNEANRIKGNIQRKKFVKSQGIFITTSGMLTGGPVIEYLKLMHHDEKSSVLLTGYQGEHTNGRLLLEEGSVFIDGWKTKVSCHVNQFDFSAHAGQSELRKLIRDVNPHAVMINHGDPAAVQAMYEWAHALDFKAYAPILNQEILIQR